MAELCDHSFHVTWFTVLDSGRHPLIAVVGPTGSGKTELSLTLSQAFSGEIVNYDSVQMYSGFDVGTAKLPPAQRLGIPHHLIDIADTRSEVTAGLFAQHARSVLAEIRSRGNLPVLVGGTGFYLRALLDGLSPAPHRAEDLRHRLKSLAGRRPSALVRFLRRFDPIAASRIHPNDLQKMIRAVEITMVSRQPVSALQARERQPLEGFSALKLGLLPGRSQLHSHLNRRTEWMFSNGLLEETRHLLNTGVARDAKAMQSLGYKQALNVIYGAQPLTAAISECQTRTRQYAKRQITWFRSEHDVKWLEGFGSDPHIQQEALRLTQEWLGSLSGFVTQAH